MEYTSDKINTDAFNKPTLPSALNVLTILSIIGSVIQIIGGIWQFMMAKKNFDEREEALKQMNNPDIPASVKKMMPDADTYIQTVTKAFENRIPLLILAMVGAGLCLWGVLEMRKLKKQGFPIYALGQLLPFIGTIALMGMGFLSGFGSIGLIITIVFILLYFIQRKHLIY